ncbi:AAA family ATPase [Helicobacter mehlei]|uniref:AAA family ATPase n=1 Tax=Helicobacter mehlei TaxID=2316080 RepID=A0A553UKS1_9HELI|nr:AAA family ATPase [Helicobacter mehlei]TSA80804.1 AAA family ATPase [Helicobacter mehlei]
MRKNNWKDEVKRVSLSEEDLKEWHCLKHLNRIEPIAPKEDEARFDGKTWEEVQEIVFNTPIGTPVGQFEEEVSFSAWENAFRVRGMLASKLCAMDELPDPEFLLQGFKRGTCGLLSSSGGSGKSFLALAIAMSMADTTHTLPSLNGLVQSRGGVLYLSNEDDKDVIDYRVWRILQHRIDQGFITNTNPVAKSLDHNFIPIDVVAGFRREAKFLIAEGNRVKNTGLARALETLIKEKRHKYDLDIKLVILDTLSRFHTLDENSNKEMVLLVGLLGDLARSANVGILMIHHSSKMGAMNYKNESVSARGASALVDNVRYHLTMSSVTLQKKSNLSKDKEEMATFEEEDRENLEVILQNTENPQSVIQQLEYMASQKNLLRLNFSKQNLGKNTTPLYFTRLGYGVLDVVKEEVIPEDDLPF